MKALDSKPSSQRSIATCISADVLTAPGARFHKPPSKYRLLTGGSGTHPEHNLHVTAASGGTVDFTFDGHPSRMNRETFVGLARKTIAAGAQFYPA